MAVVPDKRAHHQAELKRLRQYRKIVQNSIKRLTTPLSIDTDIPNPPYSPLSNATLSADEASPNNSPIRGNDTFFTESDFKADKCFFVRFDRKSKSINSRDENLESAHKNCKITIESTDTPPIDLSKSASVCISLNGDCTKNSSSLTKLDTSHDEHEKITNGKTAIGADFKINEIPAHRDEKYNLSGEPPFDFNIKDEMQHVHFGKSTLKDLRSLTTRLDDQLTKLEFILKEENEKRRKYKIENSRRTHNYEPFIMTFLSFLAKQGNLAELIERDLGLATTEEPQTLAPATQLASQAKTTTRPTTNEPAVLKQNGQNGRFRNKMKAVPTQKPKYKYVSTGRPVGRPRKNPLLPSPVKGSSTK